MSSAIFHLHFAFRSKATFSQACLNLKVCSAKMKAFPLFAKMSQEALVTFLHSTYKVMDY